jgi:hypothetical protein
MCVLLALKPHYELMSPVKNTKHWETRKLKTAKLSWPSCNKLRQ